MIQVFMNEDLLLLLLKGKTAMDLIKPFFLHFLSFLCVFVRVFEHTLGHKCECVSACVWCSMHEHIKRYLKV